MLTTYKIGYITYNIGIEGEFQGPDVSVHGGGTVRLTVFDDPDFFLAEVIELIDEGVNLLIGCVDLALEEHMRTGDLIVYTSADSVFQIAAHEEVVPLEELYDICRKTRALLTGEHALGRVIAHPFVGEDAASFTRTSGRHDYPLTAPEPTMMDKLIEAGHKVYATGKIDDLFGHRGISETFHTVDNDASTQALLDFLKEDFSGLLISNLIETDMIYGHRNDPAGYAQKLVEFDAYLPAIHAALGSKDVVMIVADHGVDPTTPSTDHSREYVPLLVFGPRVAGGVDLGMRASFADVAATIAENFGLQPPSVGNSFLGEILDSE